VDTDVQAMQARLPDLVQRLAVDDEQIASITVRSSALGTGDREQMRARWRALLGQALLDAEKSGVDG
jgi:hypothetical protein